MVWNEFEGLEFVKITILLNTHSAKFTVLQRMRETPSMRFCLGLVIILPWSRRMLYICHFVLVWFFAANCFDAFLKCTEFSGTLKLQKLIWIAWQLYRMNATVVSQSGVHACRIRCCSFELLRGKCLAYVFKHRCYGETCILTCSCSTKYSVSAA